MSYRKTKTPPRGTIRKGKFFALPFENERIQNINESISCFFFRINTTFTKLEIHSNFELHIKEEKYRFTDLETDFLDFLRVSFLGQKVLKARTDKFGNLKIELEGAITMLIEDGPFENWHYNNPIEKIYLHGGCGHFY